MAEGEEYEKRNSSKLRWYKSYLCLWKYIHCKINKEELHLEVCDKCHPFFTGKQGTTVKTGQVEKFNRKYGLNQDKAA